ncbi:MAG: transcriptional regulator [Betaproteobacteria bacterium RIFCSPLOWO2_02_FULL_65_24]|nr:MAG: transcriptional regulator [Betaproteobacteria bacterium RIFCSPLOWO2_02_FULL_65_24]OGA83645.1 MAG: transcriptional regulator [Betaproteobacteria bacterium RIFCSPLOWO2_12_FULL_66_14]
MAQILVVDDEIGIRELLSEILCDEGHSVALAENATVAREIRARARPDLVLLDIWMPDADGITLLKEWAANGQLTMPVIMMSGHGTIETAVEATRIGALDFLEKPIALQKLLATVKRALRSQEVRAMAPLSLANFGRSPVMAEFKKRLTQLAASNAPLLLRGEAGTLPELYARYLQSPGAPWINASEALSGVAHDVLSQTAGGVVFVDELAQLTRTQQKHLVFLVVRAERSKVRFISFTSSDPRDLVEGRGFDAGLLARLSELSIGVPALREHAEDIPDIANLMLLQLVETRYCPPRRFATAALNLLRNFHWPGNLASLQASVRNLSLTALEEEIGAADVERVLREARSRPAGPGLALDRPLREAREAFERAYFEHHLALENGSIARVAEKCGLERTHLYRKLKQLGISGGRRDESA